MKFFQPRYQCLAKCRRFSSTRTTRPRAPTKVIDLEKFTPDKIRNFAIVAHVDHGKSTLADRLLQLTGVITTDERAQFLDNLAVEQERGITVKAQTCKASAANCTRFGSMFYKDYLLNLIDTPGHADFNFEVSRSLSACNGMILLVAANQGVQAQTIANFWLGFNQDLIILPVINKIDLLNAKVEVVKSQMNKLFDFDPNQISCVSAKSGLNVSQLLDSIVKEVPSPKADLEKPFRALIFDSWYEQFRGAIPMIFVSEGSVVVGQKIKSYNQQLEYEVAEVGILHPIQLHTKKLSAGQVGWIKCNMKKVQEAQIGETLYSTAVEEASVTPFSKFKPNKPSIYAGLYPFSPADYEDLKRALERLLLNDSSVTIQNDSSSILGLGWRLGFLGMLHLEVFAQRLEQDYDMNVILTAPSVEYKCEIKDNDSIKKRYGRQSEYFFKDPAQYPEPVDVQAFFEPMVALTVICPIEYSSAVNVLCTEARGEREDNSLIDTDKMLLKYRVPLGEVVTGFFDDLKRVTSGYASFDYVQEGYRKTSLVKLCISINDKPLDEFSLICPEVVALKKANFVVQNLKKEIPRQQYEIKIAAKLGKSTKAIAQATIKPLKKDFTGTMKGNFGGAMDRLAKKLNHQKQGKERMRSVGNVNVPKKAFINVLRDTRFQ